MIRPYDLLENVLLDIEQGIKEGVSGETLAQQHRISEGHLRRVFKLAFDQTLSDYIRSRKLAYSVNDLIKTDNNLIDIALEYGFEYEQSFLRAFKKEFGITPGEFRKNGRIVKITPPLQTANANILSSDVFLEQESDFEPLVRMPKVFVVGGNSYGNIALPDSPYGYELWTKKGYDNKLMWYGNDENGGAAFKAEWNNVKCFNGRVGYFWNEDKPYTEYKNIYCDFNFERYITDTNAGYSSIGIYGWSKNPLIEWYIIEDWFENQSINPANIDRDLLKIGEFFVDGSTYFIYKTARYNILSIEGISTFQQYFSIRQTPRQKGTISITKHFKEWEKMGMVLGKNMYEAKFHVESDSGSGWFEAKYISFYQND